MTSRPDAMKIVAALFLLFGLTLSDAELSIERLFNAPWLSGPTPESLKISPDGKLVSFLRGGQSNQFDQDLWDRIIASRLETLLVDSGTLFSGDGGLPVARRPRRGSPRLWRHCCIAGRVSWTR